jgi:hypothetical protein
MSGIKRISAGYGLQLMLQQKKLPAFTPAAGEGKARRDCGIRSRQKIVNVLLFIQIFGRHITEFFLQNITFLSQKTAEKQVISGGSAIQRDREFPGPSGKRFPFQKNLRIIQEQNCFSFIIITL